MDNGLLQRLFGGGTPAGEVLILIVMDNGLLQIVTLDPNKGLKVLILIVMDNGLLPGRQDIQEHPDKCLNPYCNG